MTDWTILHYAVVDVEGNGQQPPELVELAIVPITGGVIGEPRNWLVKPERSITHFATRIHGITNDLAAGQPGFAAIAEEVQTSLHMSVLVAHNAHVDIGVLTRCLPGWDVPEVFDTLKLARRLLPNQSGYKLGMLVRALDLDSGLPDDLVPHRAAYDALVAARLFVRLVNLSVDQPLTLEVLRGVVPDRDDDDAPTLF